MSGETRVHLDTDFGGDIDDLCALAMLLGAPEAKLVGLTTVIDWDGRRAEMARHALRLADRGGVPVASGAAGRLGATGEQGVQDERYWPGLGAVARSRRSGEALALLEANARSGATIVAIGPFTNLALLETLRPGVFAHCPVVVMGGYTAAAAAGLPQWGPEMNYNVQADPAAALIVFERVEALVVPLGVSLSVSLRTADLPALLAGGPLAQLIAHQAVLHGADHRMSELAAANPAAPPDLLNFQYDPLACAAALSWPCVGIEEERYRTVEAGRLLTFERDPAGTARRVAVEVDAEAFRRDWLAAAVRV